MRHFLMILLVVASIAAGPRLARAGAVVTASPLAAGFASSRHRCHVQIDPFTLQTPVGRQLASFQVAIGATTVYDFRPDLSNPPSGAYTPTLPRLGFAASCDHPYTATLRATDSGDAEPVVVGQTDSFACPVAVPEASAPALGMVALLALRALAGGVAIRRPRSSRSRRAAR